MYAVIRRYAAAAAIFDELERQQAEVQELLRASVRVAADWVRRRVPNAVGAPPQVTEGEVIFSFGK